jgi:signal transduction histidine kinase
MNEKALILIIDDEESMRDSCRLILEKDGFRTASAENGILGIQKIEQLTPDLVLIDLKMPGISGLEVLDRLQKIDPNIISIVITGYATVDSAVEAMKKGAYDFLPKPFTPEELRIIIRRGLEKRRLTEETEILKREKKLMEENFITLVSHQLRSPLVAIVQYFEAILGGMIRDEKKKKDMLTKARDRLEGLLKLINDWLDIARLNGGEMTESLKPVSLAPLLKKILDFFGPLAQKEDISLILSPLHGSDIVQADGDKLEEVFSNLINNAISYNRPHGQVRVSFSDEQGFIVTHIEDTGIGIGQEHLPHVFDQFYRVKRSENQKQKGTGLGLAIAKKIIDLHKGKILVSSESGKGSTFSIYLPKGKGKIQKAYQGI